MAEKVSITSDEQYNKLLQDFRNNLIYKLQLEWEDVSISKVSEIPQLIQQYGHTARAIQIKTKNLQETYLIWQYKEEGSKRYANWKWLE